jgi:hypothetical protein
MRYNLKIIFSLITLFSFQITFGQFKLGTYKIVSDTANHWEYLFSELSFNEEKTFKYRYLTSMGCSLWYDCDGKWEINKDTLILTDTVITLYPYLGEKVLRITTYKIEETNLFYLSQRFSREQAYLRRYLFGNYRFEK